MFNSYRLPSGAAAAPGPPVPAPAFVGLRDVRRAWSRAARLGGRPFPVGWKRGAGFSGPRPLGQDASRQGGRARGPRPLSGALGGSCGGVRREAR